MSLELVPSSPIQPIAGLPFDQTDEGILRLQSQFPDHYRDISIQLEVRSPGTAKRELCDLFLRKCSDFNQLLFQQYAIASRPVLWHAGDHAGMFDLNIDQKEPAHRDSLLSEHVPTAISFAAEPTRFTYSPVPSARSSILSSRPSLISMNGSPAHSARLSINSAADSPTHSSQGSPRHFVGVSLTHSILMNRASSGQQPLTALQTLYLMKEPATERAPREPESADPASFHQGRLSISRPPCLDVGDTDGAELSLQSKPATPTGSDTDSVVEHPLHGSASRGSVSPRDSVIIHPVEQHEEEDATHSGSDADSVIEHSPRAASSQSSNSPRGSEIVHTLPTLVEGEEPSFDEMPRPSVIGTPRSLYSDGSLPSEPSTPVDQEFVLRQGVINERTQIIIRSKAPYETTYTSVQKWALTEIKNYVSNANSATNLYRQIGDYNPETLAVYLLRAINIDFDNRTLVSQVDHAKLVTLLSKYPDSKTKLAGFASICSAQLKASRDLEQAVLSNVTGLNPDGDEEFVIRSGNLISTTFMSTPENIELLNSAIGQLPFDVESSADNLHPNRLRGTHQSFHSFGRARKEIFLEVNEMLAKDAASCCALL